MIPQRIAIINGPNLNLLGQREPKIYGAQSFESYLADLKVQYLKIEFSYFQSNIEGELVEALQKFGSNHIGIILNAAAYTHTSVAIGDAVAAVACPVVEVHISNVFARESFRHTSFVAPHCVGSIAGLGLKSYELALRYLLDL